MNNSAALGQIISAFKDQQNQIDLVSILNMMYQADLRLQNSSQLLFSKLQRIIQGRTSYRIPSSQLQQIFDMSVHLKPNFDLIFEQFSQDQTISFDQLQNANNKFRLGLTKQQMQGMLRSVNPKSDKILKTQLFQFLKEK